MKRLPGPIPVAVLLGLVLGSLDVGIRPAEVHAVELGDRAATAHLAEMERAGVLVDPFWAHAYWARSRSAPTAAARIADLRWALRFDPDLHPARRALVSALLGEGESEFAAQAITLLERSSASFSAQQWALFATASVLGPALVLGLAAFALLAIGKSLPRVHHALRERLHFLPSEVREGATLLTLFLPVVLALTLHPTAALFWTILLGSVGVGKILDRWERRIVTAALLALLCAPFGTAVWTHLAEPAFPGSYLQSLWATQSANDPAAGAVLRRIAPPSAADDPAHHATLALLERRAGRFAESGRHLEAAIELDPDRWEYHNNLGNVRLLAGDPDRALTAYGRALSLAPQAALVHVNRAQAWVRKLEFTKADGDIRRAADLGYHFPRLRDGNAEALVVRDRGLDSAAIWRRFLRGAGVSGTLDWRRAGEMSLAILFPMRPMWLSLPLFLAIWYASLAHGLYRTFACATCGKLITRKSHFRILRRSLCADCYAIRQTVNAPLMREERLEERHRRVSRLPRAVGIVVAALAPGAGQLLAGSPRRGSFGLVVSAALVLMGFALGRLAPTAGPLGGPAAPTASMAVVALLYLALSVASVRRYRRRRTPEEPPVGGTHLPNPEIPAPRSV